MPNAYLQCSICSTWPWSATFTGKQQRQATTINLDRHAPGGLDKVLGLHNPSNRNCIHDIPLRPRFGITYVGVTCVQFSCLVLCAVLSAEPVYRTPWQCLLFPLFRCTPGMTPL